MTTAPPKIDIGQDVRALCTKCKSETIHVITKIDGDVIKKVYCKACNSTHVYKTLKTEAARAAKKTGATSATARKGRRSTKWTTLVADIEEDNIVDYEISKDFSSIEVIRHKNFGVGVITKVLDTNKIEVVFEENKKVLAQNWQAE